MSRPTASHGNERVSAWTIGVIGWLVLVFVAGVPLATATDYPISATHPIIPDTIQQRAKACTSCHGEHGEGLADSSDGPRLAGKPAGYLLLQMRYFQSGQRKNAAMEYVLRELDADYMRKLAAYFANQQIPYRQRPLPTVSAALLKRGEQLALHGDAVIGVPACNSCHGSRLTGVEPLIPGLIGLSSDYLQAELIAWRNQTRAAKEPFCMGVVANRMHATDINAVSAWLASQAPAANMRPEPANTQTAPLPGWCVTSGHGGKPCSDDADTEGACCGHRSRILVALLWPWPSQATVGRTTGWRSHLPSRSGTNRPGEHLVTAGGCAACHTAQGGVRYAGGQALSIPFGDVPAPNLAPDLETGMGQWTFDDFWQALHYGTGRHGELLYPVFSYTSLTKVTRAGALAIFAYLKSPPPVAASSNDT